MHDTVLNTVQQISRHATQAPACRVRQKTKTWPHWLPRCDHTGNLTGSSPLMWSESREVPSVRCVSWSNNRHKQKWEKKRRIQSAQQTQINNANPQPSQVKHANTCRGPTGHGAPNLIPPHQYLPCAERDKSVAPIPWSLQTPNREQAHHSPSAYLSNPHTATESCQEMKDQVTKNNTHTHCQTTGNVHTRTH